MENKELKTIYSIDIEKDSEEIINHHETLFVTEDIEEAELFTDKLLEAIQLENRTDILNIYIQKNIIH